ncbi:helix-turn-helix transcriptional regulator [Paraburkholderia youngii]|uniref:helix-turn-helix transcriptional regulator n=1 Tax=Paraburkholderia youngii TaxID=2782701 RepID=UPI003D1B78E1
MTTKTTTIGAKPVYLDLHAAATFVSLSEATIQKLVRENEFPPPRKISANRVAFHAFQRRRLCRPRYRLLQPARHWQNHPTPAQAACRSRLQLATGPFLMSASYQQLVACFQKRKRATS